MRVLVLAAHLTAAATGLVVAPGGALGLSGVPPRWLHDRAGTLAELPDGSFALEAARLVPRPAGSFDLVEGGKEPPDARLGGGTRESGLYALGAEAFKHHDMEEARGHFQELLALPAAERRHLSTFAAYMLGRIGPPVQSPSWFARVRELAAAGFDDPLGLAAASLGEEARSLLDRGDDAGAVKLYAEQAAIGSRSAVPSLLQVCRVLLRDPVRARRALRAPVVHQLLSIYAWTRGIQGGPGMPAAPWLIDELAATGQPAAPDVLAAAAWRANRPALAERFAGRRHTWLDDWVLAKLAVRRGDRVGADRLLATVAERLPPGEDWRPAGGRWHERPREHVEAERAILALAGGDIAAATTHALASCSWPDIAFLAERVLTIDELKALVLGGAAARSACTPTDGPAREVGVRFRQTGGLQERLSLLLARRLVRQGRGRQALRYFAGQHNDKPGRWYVQELERARAAPDDVARAQALFAAAELAHTHGMEIMGTELAPDWSWLRGAHALEDLELAVADSDLIGSDERHRLVQDLPRHHRRFQYREVAADLAAQAAFLVPPRSQAFAALLCHATRFVGNDHPERARKLWGRYVENGPFMGRDLEFGVRCPAPDFQRIRQQITLTAQLTSHVRHHRRLVMAGAAGFLLAPLVLLVLRIRRRRQVAIARHAARIEAEALRRVTATRPVDRDGS